MTSPDWIGPLTEKINGAAPSVAAGTKVLLMLAKVCTFFCCTSDALVYDDWQTITRLKNGSASLGSNSQLWRDFSCSSPGRRDEAGARDEACSPSHPALVVKPRSQEAVSDCQLWHKGDRQPLLSLSSRAAFVWAAVVSHAGLAIIS